MYYIEQLSCTSVPFFFLAGGSAGILLVSSARGHWFELFCFSASWNGMYSPSMKSSASLSIMPFEPIKSRCLGRDGLMHS